MAETQPDFRDRPRSVHGHRWFLKIADQRAERDAPPVEPDSEGH